MLVPAIIVLLVALAYGMWTYNRFVALRQRADNAFSDVDVQLKRRWDLIPPLVETVRGYAGHEHAVLAEVTAARGRAMDPGAARPAERGTHESQLARALRGVFVLAEAYPALKADTNFLSLHRALVEVEDAIQHARRYHNAVVRDLNTLRQSVPANLVGGLAGVAPRAFFQLDDEERGVPAVVFADAAAAPGKADT